MINKVFEQELMQNSIGFSCNELLSLHTSFRIGGPAEYFCTPNTIEQLILSISLCKKHHLRYYLLGKGSNVLFKDSGFSGVVICTSFLKENISVEGTHIKASSGTSLMQVCKTAMQQNLSGLEFAYGIPGSVGGAVYMNAGAYGGEMRDVLVNVTCLDDLGQIHILDKRELNLGYRTSIFSQNNWCILSAEMALASGDFNEIKSKMDDLMGRRKSKQPLEYPSAGSTFKRPEGAFAGELIDRCGLKGFRVGDAAVSEKHCGFVINLGAATCADVLSLTDQVSKIVKEKTGYILEKEIRIVE